MAADYDKLFRPHEGMEAPDDMAAQPFFDPSASFPPAPASANLPKPNGQTPPPTSDDLSERFVSAPQPRLDGWTSCYLPDVSFGVCAIAVTPARTSGVLGGRPGRWFGRGRRRSGRSGRGFADWHLCPGRCWCGAPGLMWPVRGYVGRR